MGASESLSRKGEKALNCILCTATLPLSVTPTTCETRPGTLRSRSRLGRENGRFNCYSRASQPAAGGVLLAALRKESSHECSRPYS